MPRSNSVIVYKAVVKLGDRLVSYNYLPNRPGDCDCLTYVPNKWTLPKAKGTPLFALSSISIASGYAFVFSGGAVEIWKAQATGARNASQDTFRHCTSGARESTGALFGVTLNPKALTEFWSGWTKHRYPKKPEFGGVVLCEKIKLIERIK